MDRAQFAWEEYRILRAELERHVADTQKLERYTVTGVVAFYAWVLSRPDITALPSWIWYVPTPLPILGGLRCLALNRHITVLGNYLGILERQIAESREGWEAYLIKHRYPYRSAVTTIIWLTLTVFTFAFAIWSHG